MIRAAIEDLNAPDEGARSGSVPPNVVVIVLDDVGFGQLGCFGGLGGRIQTPHLDRLAANGLRYNDFHVTPMCSPSRAALLTGRNNHSVGVGLIMELASELPGYNGKIPKDMAMLPAVLAGEGYCTWAAGKWHLTPNSEVNPLGPFDRWPLSQGFDRFYGFMSALTDQFAPSLYEDNHYLGQPNLGPDYHLTEDLVDKSIEWLALQQALAPDRPFLHYLAPGAMHSPHQVAEAWIRPYEGKFADGWDVIRSQTLEMQKRLQIVPQATELPPPNPGVPAWSSFTPEERRLLEREMEVFAGFMTHTDAQIGRLIDDLEKRGILDETIILVLSDNGASAEGGRLGIVNEVFEQNGVAESMEDKLASVDRLGGPGISNIYAAGWAMAGNTPNRWYKRQVHEGGTRSPLIVHWPAGIASRGEVRSQFHHVVDIYPTVLEAAGVAMPSRVRGVEQCPLEGTSMLYSFSSPAAKTRKAKQYFETLGHRALWRDGWKIVTSHQSSDFQRSVFGRVVQQPTDGDFTSDRWELYRLDEDFSESRDLALQYPELVREMEAVWWEDAARYRVLPLDDRFIARARANRNAATDRRALYRFREPLALTVNGSPNLKGVPYRIDALLELGSDAPSGAVLSDGGASGGYGLYLDGGWVVYISNYLGLDVGVLRVALPEATANVHIAVTFEMSGDTGDPADNGGVITLSVNGGSPVAMEVRRTNITRYDHTGEGLRIGSDTNGVWSGIRPPATLSAAIREVSIARDVLSAPNDGGPEAESALSAQ